MGANSDGIVAPPGCAGQRGEGHVGRGDEDGACAGRAGGAAAGFDPTRGGGGEGWHGDASTHHHGTTLELTNVRGPCLICIIFSSLCYSTLFLHVVVLKIDCSLIFNTLLFL